MDHQKVFHLDIFTTALVAKFQVASGRIQKVPDVLVVNLQVGHRHLHQVEIWC